MIYFLAFIAGAALSQGLPLMPRLITLVLALLIPTLVLKRRAPVALMLTAGFTLALATAPHGPPAEWDNPITVMGHFSRQPKEYEHYNVQEFIASEASGELPGSFNVISDETFDTGRAYTLKLRMFTSRQRMNPGAWEGRGPFARLVEVMEEGGLLTSPAMRLRRLSENLYDHIGAVMPIGEASLVRAVTTGRKDSMPQEIKEAFRRAGLAHLLSISGTHFGFFAVTVFFLLRAAIELLPGRYLLLLSMRLSPSQAASVLSLPFLIFYLGLSGGNPPSVRAFVMIVLFLLGLLISTRGGWKGFLAAAAFVLVLLDPSVIGTPSFLMSFSAVLFIGLSLRDRKDKGSRAAHDILILRPLKLTVAAMLGVMPFVLHWFHELSIVSPIANVVVTSLAGFVLIPLALAGAVGYALAGHFFTAPLVSPVAGAAINLTSLMASPEWAAINVPPMPPIMVPVYFACTLPLLLWRRRGLLWLAAVPFALYAVLAISWSLGRDNTVTFLDTGSSDASVLELGDKAVVIDTARRGTEARGYLWSMGIRDIDLLILTHPHADHIGGTGRLAEYFDIKEVWMPVGMEAPEGLSEETKTLHLRRGDTLERFGMTFEALHPYEGFTSDGKYLNARTNDGSLVLGISSEDGPTLLMAGDLQSGGISALREPGGDKLKADILKLPHHARNRTESERMLRLTEPKLAVITGHLRALEMPSDTGLLATGRDGAVKLSLSSPAAAPKTYMSFAPSPYPLNVAGELRNLSYLFKRW